MWKFDPIFVLAFLVALVLTPLVRILAFRFKILDYPKKHGIHAHPVPRIGGIAIYIAFIIGSLYRMDLSEMLKGVLVASSMIFIVGLWDDLFHLKASFKLAVQLLACGIMMFKYGVILNVFRVVPLNAFFTVLGVIGMTNAVNFLDNMDGLASGLVAISSFTIFMIAYVTKQMWLAYLSMALVGACLGFLFFNLKKAYVFMGDSGSTFLGFTLASLAVMAEWSYFKWITVSVPTLILGVPILDMFLITVLRFKENKVRNLKEWIDYTGKDHLSHRVMRLGLGNRGAVFALWALQAFLCWIAVKVFFLHSVHGFFAFLFFLAFAFGSALLFRRKRNLLLYLNGRRKLLCKE